MKIFDIFKVTKNALVGKGFYENKNYSTSENQNAENYFEPDSHGDGESDKSISEEDLSKFESVLRKFYSRLSQTEMDDSDLDKIMDEIQDRFFEGKITNPERALNDAYHNWKSTKNQRREKQNKTRDTILEMLRNYDALTEKEKSALTDWEHPLYLGNLKKRNSKAVKEIVQSWYDDMTIDEEKCILIDCISSSEAEQWFPHYSITETPLIEPAYKQLIVLYNYDKGTHELYYKELADYCKRYWLNSGNKPQPIETDDLLVNRPCYMITELKLCTPRFHLGKRYFEEEESYQKTKVFLFADKLEYICDGGHMDIELEDIIDISINDWGQIAFKWQGIREWHDRNRYGDDNTKPCPEKPEPELLEITCRNNHKLLFTDTGNNSDLLILRAIMFYFIKNPQYEKLA